MIIGIDIGGTTTDIVGLKGSKIINPLTVKADDPVTSAAGALGKFLEAIGASLNEVATIAATGVGSNEVKTKLFGIPVVKVDEFTAIGTAGSFLSGVDKGVVVSMGTGTAIVTVNEKGIKHWGGSGVGGGTLLGLARKMLNITNLKTLVDMASRGNLDRVDLTVGDIAGRPINNLPASTTASNFGKLADEATDKDVALAILNLVGQTIGVLSIAAAHANNLETIILTGKLTSIKPLKGILNRVADLHKTKFIIPENADFATVIGAAITLANGNIK
ncbi:Type II pantothenate kinase [subsurface metagenome]